LSKIWRFKSTAFPQHICRSRLLQSTGCQAQTSVKICLLSFVPCAYDSLTDLCAAGLLALQHTVCRQPAGRATLAAPKVGPTKRVQLVSRSTLPAATRWCLPVRHANVLCRHYFWNEVTGDTQYEDPGGMRLHCICCSCLYLPVAYHKLCPSIQMYPCMMRRATATGLMTLDSA